MFLKCPLYIRHDAERYEEEEDTLTTVTELIFHLSSDSNP